VGPYPAASCSRPRSNHPNLVQCVSRPFSLIAGVGCLHAVHLKPRVAAHRESRAAAAQKGVRGCTQGCPAIVVGEFCQVRGVRWCPTTDFKNRALGNQGPSEFLPPLFPLSQTPTFIISSATPPCPVLTIIELTNPLLAPTRGKVSALEVYSGLGGPADGSHLSLSRRPEKRSIRKALSFFLPTKSSIISAVVHFLYRDCAAQP